MERILKSCFLIWYMSRFSFGMTDLTMREEYLSHAALANLDGDSAHTLSATAESGV
jgi:hypothetical protein